MGTAAGFTGSTQQGPVT
uniref:Uncharacterized protein n=1 Tax=Arundo donax TaxID=35708 RepID=A0A0A9EAQ6_ARUDO